MENKLIDYFLKIATLTAEEVNLLKQSMVVKTYAKGSYLLKEGQMGGETYFILNGIVRKFQLQDGNDVTTNFYTEEQWIISPEGLSGQEVSTFNLLCMEDTTVVIGDEQKALVLFKQFPHFEKLSRQIVETAFLEQQSLMASYITDKPEQRYLKLLQTRPEILQRIPQYDIATYIGVKPESLSRIRKKLVNKK